MLSTQYRIPRMLLGCLLWGGLTLTSGLIGCGGGGATSASHDPTRPTATVQLALLGSDEGADAFSLQVTDTETGITVFDDYLATETVSLTGHSSDEVSVQLILNTDRLYRFDVAAYDIENGLIGQATKEVFLPAGSSFFDIEIVLPIAQPHGVAPVITSISLNDPASFDSILIEPANPEPGQPFTFTAIGEDWEGEGFDIDWTLPQALGGDILFGQSVIAGNMPMEPGLHTFIADVVDPYGQGTSVEIDFDFEMNTLSTTKWTILAKYDLDGSGGKNSEMIIKTRMVAGATVTKVYIDKNNNGKLDSDDYNGTFQGAPTSYSQNGTTGTVTVGGTTVTATASTVGGPVGVTQS